MSTILPFPGRPPQAATLFLNRAKALQQVTLHLQTAALELAEEVGNLMGGDRPTPADHSMSGKTAAELGEALRHLILANGMPGRDLDLAVALNRWLKQEHGR